MNTEDKPNSDADKNHPDYNISKIVDSQCINCASFDIVDTDTEYENGKIYFCNECGENNYYHNNGRVYFNP